MIHSDFKEKFGIPRQSGLVWETRGIVVLEEKYRDPQAFLGIEEYSHLWLLWDFSRAHREEFVPTVYPPRLGGKEKRGVFATGSPYRHNSIGLSCVKLEQVIWEGENAPYLVVVGADLLDGTPIYDIKPYLPYADAYPQAKGGFGQEHSKDAIVVEFPRELLEQIPREKQEAVVKLLEQDPRAAYQKKDAFVYGLQYGNQDIRFTVEEDVLTVRDVVRAENTKKVK